MSCRAGSRSRAFWPGVLVVLGATIAAFPAPAAARDETQDLSASSWTLSLEAATRYLWRGMPWSEGAVLQPALQVVSAGWTFGLWANYELSRTREMRGFNEVDIEVSYALEWPGMSLEPGFSVFLYSGPNQADPATVEAALGFSAALAGPVSVYLEQNLDLGAYPGAYYAEAGLSLEHALLPSLGLDAALGHNFATADFNRAYWELSESLFDAMFLRASLTWSIGSGYFVQARIEEVLLTAGQVRDAAGRRSFFVFGLAFGLEH